MAAVWEYADLLPRRKELAQPFHQRRPFLARRRTSPVGRRLPRTRLQGSRPEPEPKLKRILFVP